MHNVDKGALGEMLATIELTRQGWDVFQPVSHNTRIDLIAHKDGVFRTIQVKTTTERTQRGNKDSIPLYLKKSHHNPKYDFKYEASDFDYFCLVEPNESVVIFFSAEEALKNKSTVYFSLGEGLRKASDFRLLT